MKKALFALLIPALLISCSKVGVNEFIINGEVKGVDGKNVILQRQDDSLGTVAVDTAKIEKGKFKFQGNITEPAMYSLQIESVKDKSFLVVENAEIDIEVDKDSVFKNKISGSYNNEQLSEFGQMSVKLQKELMDFQKKNQQKFMQAMQAKDTVTQNKLRKEFETLQKKSETQTIKYIKDHPKSFITILLIQSRFRANFEPNIPEIQGMYDALDPELKKTKAAKKLKKILDENNKVEIGRRAPEFSGPTPDGKTVSLKAERGKVTIVDFWASWCGPCRKANPELVAIYNELHPKGLNIIGVSLDRPGKADDWKAAIANDKLAWTQVSNLQEWKDPIAKRYGVEEIPASFVVNQYGIIVGKNLHGEELKAKINEWLAKPDVPK
ncbi:MAG: AhpC/TSA family protein [Flavobacterium sp.]|uniref:TlpA disulfide reductase family protein n=1 Tax=Flavobacterium sp. TaxID=239 RepID=UPI00120C2907|nr:TlpA disulfide reductase family protein [Flavobacterium sp.]RZJ66159.1 MAG: AhpC/TSA family protein [Flavobacterium sp.]